MKDSYLTTKADVLRFCAKEQKEQVELYHRYNFAICQARVHGD
jgi:hypothetical protein